MKRVVWGIRGAMELPQSPSSSRLLEIEDFYRTLGLDPTAPAPGVQLPLADTPDRDFVVTPLLSNNSSFH